MIIATEFTESRFRASQPLDGEEPLYDYGPTIADWEIPRRRRLWERSRHLFPAYRAASAALRRLLPRVPADRLPRGLILATNEGDSPAIRLFQEQFLRTVQSEKRRRMDTMVALSRFVPGSLLVDLAAFADATGPLLCLDGTSGLCPLWLGGLLIAAGRARSVIVVAVDPVGPQRSTYESVAVLLEETSASGYPAQPPRAFLCDPREHSLAAIRRFLSSDPNALPIPELEDTDPAVYVTHYAERPLGFGPAGDAEPPQIGLRGVIESCSRNAGREPSAIIGASYLSGRCDEVFGSLTNAMPSGQSEDDWSTDGFRKAIESISLDIGAPQPPLILWGTPGASFSALQVAVDLLRTTPRGSVIVAAVDRSAAALAHALDFLRCPDRDLFRGIASAVRLSLAPAGTDMFHGRTIRITNRCEIGWDGPPDPPSETPPRRVPVTYSGCTSEDLLKAREDVCPGPAEGSLEDMGRPFEERFLGVDALVCLGRCLPKYRSPFSISVANRLGGRGSIDVY